MLAIYIPGGLLAVSFAIASAKLKMTPGGPPVEGPLVQRMGFLEFVQGGVNRNLSFNSHDCETIARL